MGANPAAEVECLGPFSHRNDGTTAMNADRLYVSERAASDAATKAVIENKADSFRVRPQRQRNPDRSWDFGFVAILMKSGRTVGFA